MKKINYKKIAAFIVSTLILLLTVVLFSEAAGTAQAPVNGSMSPTISNPLGAKNTEVKDILISIMNIVAMVGGIVVVFFIIYSGFKFVTAGDSDTDRAKAKEIFYATVIGGAILLGADVIANVVVNTVNTIRK